MDKKNLEDMFNVFWKSYLDLEKKIWKLEDRCKQEPSEVLQAKIYDLCSIGLGQLGNLEYMVSNVYNGQVLDNFQSACRIKINDLREISSKVMSSRTK